MSMLTDVGTYLAAASISTADLTLGTNLFLGRLPESPDTCVGLVQTAGTAPTNTFGTSYPPNQTLTSTLYLKIEAQQSPFALDRDSQERLIMSCNFLIAKVL